MHKRADELDQGHHKDCDQTKPQAQAISKSIGHRPQDLVAHRSGSMMSRQNRQVPASKTTPLTAASTYRTYNSIRVTSLNISSGKGCSPCSQCNPYDISHPKVKNVVKTSVVPSK